MITCSKINFGRNAGVVGDCSFGNRLNKIAGIIGIATKNGYQFGFPNWIHQEYFVNKLPLATGYFTKTKVRANFAGYDFNFQGFQYKDNFDIDGEFGSFKYIEHCEGLIRHYFELKPLCEPFTDCILMHFRNYNNTAWAALDKSYYSEALKKFPKKRVIVVTDNIEAAHKTLGGSYEYTSNSPIIDFYLLSNTAYMVMGNSTFSRWASWLSGAETVAPLKWYAGPLKDAPVDEIYMKKWILI
jgi:hypothetical protein